MRKLSELKNIGKTVEKKLNSVGIFTESDLQKLGSVKVYKLLKANEPGKTLPACYYLYSIEGAITDTHWNNLPEEVKSELKNAVKNIY
jgi:DNA transformation protein and related proteins